MFNAHVFLKEKAERISRQEIDKEKSKLRAQHDSDIQDNKSETNSNESLVN